MGTARRLPKHTVLVYPECCQPYTSFHFSCSLARIACVFMHMCFNFANEIGIKWPSRFALFFSLVRGYWIFSMGLFPVHILSVSFPVFLIELFFLFVFFINWNEVFYILTTITIWIIEIFFVFCLFSFFFNLPGIWVYIFPCILLQKFSNTESWNHFTVNTHRSQSRLWSLACACLGAYLFICPSHVLSIKPSYFWMRFKVSHRHQYTSP